MHTEKRTPQPQQTLNQIGQKKFFTFSVENCFTICREQKKPEKGHFIKNGYLNYLLTINGA